MASIKTGRYRHYKGKDQQDAYAIARWLKEVGWGLTLEDVYFDVAMTGTDLKMA